MMSSDDETVPDLVEPTACIAGQLDSEPMPVNTSSGQRVDINAELSYENPVPVLLLTGYLGSGKTTLVNHILSAKHGYRCAVLLNEIGDTADIEKALVKEPEGQEAAPVTDWVELENGCICCSVKNEMVKALESLLQQRTRFDYIIIETTGLANPGPVASALWTDAELESSLCLDAIVTVVDAVNISRHLDTPNAEKGQANEAQRQLAFADIILLNKLDLIDSRARDEVVERVREINMDAKIIECVRCDIDLGDILHTGIYSGTSNALHYGSDHSDHVCTESCEHHSHGHTSEVGTYTLRYNSAINLDKFRKWLDEFLWERDEVKTQKEIYRVKGLLYVMGSNKKHILQAVHELYDIFEGIPWGEDEERHSKLVFIGKNLDENVIQSGLKESFESI